IILMRFSSFMIARSYFTAAGEVLCYYLRNMTMIKAIVLMICLLFISCFASAEDKTRAAIWDEQREMKSHELKPVTSNAAERLFLQIENGAGLNFKSFYPTYGAGSPGSGFMPGVRFWKPHVFGSPFDFQTSASYSTKSYQLYQLQFGTI